MNERLSHIIWCFDGPAGTFGAGVQIVRITDCKLNRMDKVSETDKEFICRNAPMPDLSTEKIFPGGIRVKALFTPDMKWRLVEEFGPHCFTEADDGRLLFTADYTDMENLVTWLMTFGAKAEVIEPAEARDIIRRNAEETLKIYGGLG